MIRTVCPYCGVGCGLRIEQDESGAFAVSGDPRHPANFGRICSKGAALGETLGLDGRLLHPMLRDAEGSLAATDWPNAIDTVANGFRRVLDRAGPDAIAFYLSGQLLTEDYYVANKLMKGFLGSANVDTNSRLCMASSVAGHRRAFGADTVPGLYADLDAADLIVLVGSNAAWCHPVLFQRMLASKAERGAALVVIDPRRTATADDADLFLSIAPGTDTALFCGMLVHLAEHGAINKEFMEAHTSGFALALARAREIAPDIAATAQRTGLAPEDVASFFNLFRTRERSVTCYSQGVNQSAQGTDKVNAIINCHLATGRIGKPGVGPFSLTGQPNAMGGREVGGLANQLAAHMSFTSDDIDRVRRFWKAPRMARREGRKAVAMFEAIERGEIKALWVMATNPAVSLPRAGAMRGALKKLELFVVSDNVLETDTNSTAQVLLPAAAWGEKEGTVTNSERRISRQRAFLPLPGEARPDWWIISQVAQRMGFAEAFAFQSAADVFREHAALSAFENNGTRDFDLGGMADISDDDYGRLEPVQWPVRAGNEACETRFFAAGGFFTPDRKARFIAPEPPALSEETSPVFALRLNTGRIRDQWHTMTRTGRSPRLAAHLPEPFVEVHPQDAGGLSDGGFARVTTAHGSCIVKVTISPNQRPGSIFMPIHWSDQTASCARLGDLVSAQVDPYSGQPEAKATPCTIASVDFALRGCARIHGDVALPEETWWVRLAVREGSEYRFATSHGPLVWHDFAHRVLTREGELAEELNGATYRAAAFTDAALDGWICVAPDPAALAFDPAALAAPSLSSPAGHPATQASRGPRCGGGIKGGGHRPRLAISGVGESPPIICACFGIATDTVYAALKRGAARTVDDIGRLLRAGSNCGSCLPELRKIVRKTTA